MALDKVDKTVIDNVEAAEKEEQRETALAEVKATKEVAAPEATAEGNLPTKAVDPMAALAALGFENLQIDFTSFPTMVINKGKIRVSGGEVVDDGESFEFIIMDKRKTFLFRGIEDRDSDPELAYSDDKEHINMTGEPVADKIAEWKEKGWDVEIKDYFIVMGKMVGGDLDGEIIQIQIPKTSIGRFDGLLVSIAIAGNNPKEVVVKALVGKEIGSGLKAFNPWDFKLAK